MIRSIDPETRPSTKAVNREVLGCMKKRRKKKERFRVPDLNQNSLSINNMHNYITDENSISVIIIDTECF